MSQCLFVGKSDREKQGCPVPSSAALWIVSARERNPRYKKVKHKVDDMISLLLYSYIFTSSQSEMPKSQKLKQSY